MPESTLKTSTWTTIAHWNSLIWNASGNNSTANLHRISAEAPTLVHRMCVCDFVRFRLKKLWVSASGPAPRQTESNLPNLCDLHKNFSQLPWKSFSLSLARFVPASTLLFPSTENAQRHYLYAFICMLSYTQQVSKFKKNILYNTHTHTRAATAYTDRAKPKRKFGSGKCTASNQSTIKFNGIQL